jgi:hypothetical protein
MRGSDILDREMRTGLGVNIFKFVSVDKLLNCNITAGMLGKLLFCSGVCVCVCVCVHALSKHAFLSHNKLIHIKTNLLRRSYP